MVPAGVASGSVARRGPKKRSMRRMTSGRLARRMAAPMSAEKLSEGFDFGGVFGVVALDGGGEVLVAEVEDGEADGLGLLGDAGADEGAAEGDAAAAGGEDLVGVAVEVEAEELAVLGVGAEDGADGVVGADGFEADLHAGDVAAVDFGSGADLGDVDLAVSRMARNCSSRAAPGAPKSLAASWRTRPA